MKRIGSRAEVYHGKALKTSGNLKKKDLFKDKHGCIKSKKASNRARKNKNLGDLLKQKGSGCFDYKKKVNVQLGGGKNKKDTQLEKHIFIFSDGIQTFTLPNKYKGSRLSYKCKCPFANLLKHNVSDHIERPEFEIMDDPDMGFIFPKKCALSNKKMEGKCGCGFGKEHKIKEHKKKSKKKKSSQKGGFKFAKKFGKFAKSANKMAKKGTAFAQKAAVKGQQFANKANVYANKFEQGLGKAQMMANQADAIVGQGMNTLGQLQQMAPMAQGALQGLQGLQGSMQGLQNLQGMIPIPQQMLQQMPQQMPQQMMIPQSPGMMRRGGKKKKAGKKK